MLLMRNGKLTIGKAEVIRLVVLKWMSNYEILPTCLVSRVHIDKTCTCICRNWHYWLTKYLLYVRNMKWNVLVRHCLSFKLFLFNICLWKIINTSYRGTCCTHIYTNPAISPVRHTDNVSVLGFGISSITQIVIHIYLPIGL